MNFAFYAGCGAITFFAGLIVYAVNACFPNLSETALGLMFIAVYSVLFICLLKAVGAKSVHYRGSNYEVSFEDSPEHRAKMEALKAQAQKAERDHQGILDALERYRCKNDVPKSIRTNNLPKVPKDWKGPLI